MTVFKCPECGTNIYQTSTGWSHYNTGTESCFDAGVPVDEDEPDEQQLGWRTV